MDNTEVKRLGQKLVNTKFTNEQMNFLIDALTRKKHREFADSLMKEDLDTPRCGIILDLLLKAGYSVKDVMRMCDVPIHTVVMHKNREFIDKKVVEIMQRYNAQQAEKARQQAQQNQNNV